jgi:tetratricopeptide (TPR) repeat protein
MKTAGVVFSGIAALAAGICFCLETSQAQSDAGAGPKSFDGETRETYDFRFGEGKIATPGSAASEGNRFIGPRAFPSAEYCAHCHEEAYSQWRQALHSNSFRTPFYRASVNILARTKGIEYTRHCDSCHNPVGVLSGALTRDSQLDREFDRDGLTCMTCHSIQRLQPSLGNGSFVMGVPSVTVDEAGNRIPGEVAYDEITKYPKRHAQAVMKDFYRTAEFCAACHKANLPNTLNEYKWIRAFSSYDEWQGSKFSRRNPLTFYPVQSPTVCQGCHMQRAAPLLHDSGAKDGTFASHRWPAGNTAVPYFYGFDAQLEKTVEFLQAGNYLNVDLFALIKKQSAEKTIAPLGSVPFELTAGETLQVMVVVQNKNIGHSLVPEVRDLYEAWVEFTVTDGSGKEIYHSGFLKPNGMLDERAHSFTNRPVNNEGDFVDNHKVWTIHSMAYDNSIQAGRSALVRYEFTVPARVQGPLTMTARVNYRHLRESYLNNVLGQDHPAYPVVEIASRSRTLRFGANTPAAPDARDNPDWMRWNNLGIAYLDQLQYAESIRAFEEVVKTRPDYADGHTNLGVAYIEWEKYGEARVNLEKGLSLSQDPARALYYLGIVERREGHSEAELADLQEVVARYPQSRDARRELGISYYQQHRPEEAVKQFEALQAIDPDDVAAHYNLAILYRRLGLREKASEQAALFATKQVDPGAPTYSLDFLRRHPEISTESAPWHMHKDAVPDSAEPKGQH